MASVRIRPRSPSLNAGGWQPEPVEITLDSGLRVIVAERLGSPLTEMRLVSDRGFAAEPRGRSGLAGLAMAMFNEGALRIGRERLDLLGESLGAKFGGRIFADGAIIEVSALSANLLDVLAICGRLLADFEFEREDFERVRAERLALIASERRNASELSLRILPSKLYGRGHPYSRPFSGSGMEPDVATLTADDMREYYKSHFSPERVTLVMVGPLAMEEAKPLLERTIGVKRSEPVMLSNEPDQNIADRAASRTTKSGITIVTRPNAEQAVLVAGLPTVPRGSKEAEALIVADAIVAGMFSSRLNLKLREERGWTYGVRSSLIDARLQGLWFISCFVRHDRAVAAMTWIDAEFEAMAGARVCSASEVRHAVDFLVGRMPSTHETCSQIADMLARNVIYRLPFECERAIASRMRELEPRDISRVCQQIRETAAPHWVVVGDSSLLADEMGGAGYAEIETLYRNSVP